MAVGDRLSVGPGGIPKSLNSTINSGSHLVSWGRKRGQLTGRSGGEKWLPGAPALCLTSLSLYSQMGDHLLVHFEGETEKAF